MNVEIFMRFISFFVCLFLAGIGIKKLVKHYPVFKMSASIKYPLKEIFIFLVKDKTVLKKLFFTIAMLIIFKAACFIPLPGLNTDALGEVISHLEKSNTSFISFIPRILKRISVFALGIMPYLSACFLIQIIFAIIPKLRKFLFGGERGWIKIRKYTYILAICLSVLQANFVSRWLQNPSPFFGINIVSIEGWEFSLLTMLVMAGATALLIFIAELINRYGLGNGIAMLALAGILTRIAGVLYEAFKLHTSNRLSFIMIIS